jgi:hypothetical protein
MVPSDRKQAQPQVPAPVPRPDTSGRNRISPLIIRWGAKLCLAHFSLVALATPLAAQEEGWKGFVEASGTILFGNARERLLASRVQLGRADSTVEFRSDARIAYAQGTNDQGRSQVTGRVAFASVSVDHRPFARFSPFAFGTIESSLQQRIDRRISSGAGAKALLQQSGENEVSVSLALLAEHTRPLDPGENGIVVSTSRTRWSLRARTQHQITPTVRLSHVTFYQPTVGRTERFTVNSTTSLAANVTSTVALTVTFQDSYDSEARRRGARSNNDGQLLFGVRAGF